ncbi:hypothetical protein KP509_11G082300 [Ceratopteris richardii]|uniref:Uncharacterized protein n=1 Tax=Ceratopteris richardii TaxID=49495 RepID=A0A8T2TUF6_CERRI|nr:hypothetical protein KP509_11G082300 [Ceratopteris richardii]
MPKQEENEPELQQLPKPHRCNDRLEDFVQALFEDNFRKNVPATWKLFWQCYKSNPGEEPTEPFYFLKINPPVRQEKVLESD